MHNDRIRAVRHAEGRCHPLLKEFNEHLIICLCRGKFGGYKKTHCYLTVSDTSLSGTCVASASASSMCKADCRAR